MKKHYLVIPILVLLFLFIIPNANAKNNSATVIEYVYVAEEFDGIVKALNSELFDEKSNDTFQNSFSDLSPYKLYSVSADIFAELASNPDKIDEILLDDYNWIIADENGKVSKIGRMDGQWQVLGYSTSSGETEQAMLTQARYVKNILNENKNVSDAGKETVATANNSTVTYICFDVPQYHTSFLCSFSDNGITVIPFGNRPDLTGIENGKEYDIKEIASLLRNDVSLNNANVNGGTGNISNERKENNNSSESIFGNVVAGVICLVAIAGFGMFLFVFRKRRKN